MATANKKPNTEQLIESEVRRRMLNLEPDIYQAVALAETLSHIVETEGSVSHNTLAYLVYELDARGRKTLERWKTA
jgi:hypothetical protein